MDAAAMLKTQKLGAVDVAAFAVDGESPAMPRRAVVVRARRRRCNAEFKAGVLREADRCKHRDRSEHCCGMKGWTD